MKISKLGHLFQHHCNESDTENPVTECIFFNVKTVISPRLSKSAYGNVASQAQVSEIVLSWISGGGASPVAAVAICTHRDHGAGKAQGEES